jgi:hypothetical protein
MPARSGWDSSMRSSVRTKPPACCWRGQAAGSGARPDHADGHRLIGFGSQGMSMETPRPNTLLPQRIRRSILPLVWARREDGREGSQDFPAHTRVADCRSPLPERLVGPRRVQRQLAGLWSRRSPCLMAAGLTGGPGYATLNRSPGTRGCGSNHTREPFADTSCAGGSCRVHDPAGQSGQGAGHGLGTSEGHSQVV